MRDSIDPDSSLDDSVARLMARSRKLSGTANSPAVPARQADDLLDVAFKAINAATQARLDQIDAALARISLGTYGQCENCGQAIALARLEARPATCLCGACDN
jgi:RNA polymerase-binding transcription factor DksA